MSAGDHLVSCFVASGLVPGCTEEWQRSREALGAFKEQRREVLEEHLEVCQGLLRSSSLRCGEP